MIIKYGDKMSDDDLFTAWHSFLVVLNNPFINDRGSLYDRYLKKLADYYSSQNKLIKFSEFIVNIDKNLSIEVPVPNSKSLVPYVKRSIELMGE